MVIQKASFGKIVEPQGLLPLRDDSGVVVPFICVPNPERHLVGEDVEEEFAPTLENLRKINVQS
ncbi:MAG: hypothetical protein NUV70_08235 [Caldiserica bacterium]|nr:hypothetical protein [Caldisericota bacterium]